MLLHRGYEAGAPFFRAPPPHSVTLAIIADNLKGKDIKPEPGADFKSKEKFTHLTIND